MEQLGRGSRQEEGGDELDKVQLEQFLWGQLTSMNWAGFLPGAGL